VYVCQVPWEFQDWVFPVQENLKDGHKVPHLQAGILDVLDGLEKAFVQVDCPYCNIRRVGLGQDDLRV
jgi:hypothetical protein